MSIFVFCEKYIKIYFKNSESYRNKSVNDDEKKFWLFGVINACPLNSELDTCQFKSARKKPAAERWNTVAGFSDGQLDNLITIHRNCVRERELKSLKK